MDGAKAQASPLNRGRSVLAPAPAPLSSIGSFDTPAALDKAAPGSAAKKNPSLKDPASPAAKATAPEAADQGPVIEATVRATDRSADLGSAAKPDAAEQSSSDADGDATSSPDSIAAAVAGRVEASPLAAQAAAAAMTAASFGAVAGAAPAAANQPSHSPLAAAPSAHGPRAEKAESPLGGGPAVAGAVAGHPVFPGAAAGHRAHRETAAPNDPAAATSTRAAGAANPVSEANAGHKAAVADVVAPPALVPPEAIVAPKPATVDAGALSAHLAGQSFGLSPGANLPPLFEAAASPPAAAAFFAQVAEDPTLHGAVLTDSAHVSLDAGAAGEITLHLRVKDGVADVRVEGAGAPTLAIRPHELQAALASEGLTLGGFESGQVSRDSRLDFDRQQNDNRRQTAEQPAQTVAGTTAATAPSNRTTAAIPTLGGRLHVTA
ncbi:MAG TPA: hypothetical protein VH374_22395 [Polyangia bacterium]|nr:hypothetical protein [Polyangia bacterium]